MLVFLAGLGLHLNHLIAEYMRISHWSFGTSFCNFFVVFARNETKGHSRTYSSHFSKYMSFYDNFSVFKQ